MELSAQRRMSERQGSRGPPRSAGGGSPPTTRSHRPPAGGSSCRGNPGSADARRRGPPDLHRVSSAPHSLGLSRSSVRRPRRPATSIRRRRASSAQGSRSNRFVRDHRDPVKSTRAPGLRPVGEVEGDAGGLGERDAGTAETLDQVAREDGGAKPGREHRHRRDPGRGVGAGVFGLVGSKAAGARQTGITRPGGRQLRGLASDGDQPAAEETGAEDSLAGVAGTGSDRVEQEVGVAVRREVEVRVGDLVLEASARAGHHSSGAPRSGGAAVRRAPLGSRSRRRARPARSGGHRRRGRGRRSGSPGDTRRPGGGGRRASGHHFRPPRSR